MQKYCVVIVAGGKGSRMNSTLPKQFMLIGGKPLLMHTISAFYNFNKEIQINLVLPNSQIDFWKSLCEKYNFSIKHEIVAGGNERFFSVKNGIAQIADNVIVGVHDGVRPFVSTKTIAETFEAAEKFGAAIPVLPIVDSLRQKYSDTESHIVDRSKYVLVQTPQCFHSEILKKAYSSEYNPLFTDDASVVEMAIKQKITLTQGNRENIKITTPYDIQLAEWIISKKNAESE